MVQKTASNAKPGEPMVHVAQQRLSSFNPGIALISTTIGGAAIANLFFPGVVGPLVGAVIGAMIGRNAGRDEADADRA